LSGEGLVAEGIQLIAFRDAQYNVAVPIAADPEARKQPAKDQIGTGRTLPDHQGVAETIGDIGDLHPGAAPARRVLPGNQHAIHPRPLASGGVDLIILGCEAPGGRIAHVGMAAAMADAADALVRREGNRVALPPFRYPGYPEGAPIRRTAKERLFPTET